MTTASPQTPVIVGIGFEQDHNEDPSQSPEALELMLAATRRAASDAGSDEILKEIESISVPQGLWQYRNPGRLIGESLGCPGAKSVISDLGVLQLTLLSELCQAISNGEQQIGVIVGGEAKYRDLRSRITQQTISDTEQAPETPRPEIHHTSQDPFCTDLEAEVGLQSPVEFFSIIETALRHDEGLGVEEHRDVVANLYSQFSGIAAENPHAWRRETVPAEEIRNAVGKNSMLAFPYTKKHSSQWNVNRAVAIIVCSAAKAEELGLNPQSWVYPLAAVQSRHVVPLAQQRQLHSHPGTVMAGERALALAEAKAEDIKAAELYSCFPAAVRSFAKDLKLPAGCPWSVTGAMPFSGGPFNHVSLEGVARMAEVLRAERSERRIGMVSNLSGIFGKQGCAIFSNQPNAGGYGYDDITDAVAAKDLPLAMNEGYLGAATVVGYTVVYQGGSPSHAIAICETPDGERTVVKSEEKELLDQLTTEEFCGRQINVHDEHRFTAIG
jgi:acetyl-CoA C-acetyltransferase